MSHFIDEVRVQAASGAGGDGIVAFRREKYVPRGGPAGGDGGRGGDVVFVATRDKNTLLHLRFRPQITAGSGGHGGASNRHGASGEDAVVEVPVGTLIKEAKTGRVLADLDVEGARAVVLQGGGGGAGNSRFTTSTRQAPDFAKEGRPGEERDLALELKLMADVGLLGFPNAGKSTLIARLSAARPKIAAYPFTTLVPSLGVVQIPNSYDSFVMADIPGLIEGAADGVGLGHRFLRHVERCAVLLHLIALDPMEEAQHGDALRRHDAISQELKRFDPELARRPQMVLLSKADLVTAEELGAVTDAFAVRGIPVLVASAVRGDGLDALIFALAAAVRVARGLA